MRRVNAPAADRPSVEQPRSSRDARLESRFRLIIRALALAIVCFVVRTLSKRSMVPGSGAAPEPATLATPPHAFTRLGTHIIVEVQHAPFDVLNSSARTRAALLRAVDAADLTIVGEHFHTFPVQGVSGVLLIRCAPRPRAPAVRVSHPAHPARPPRSESHLSVHTWPELGYAAVDLFTCGAATPLPCGPGVRVRYQGPQLGWACPDGARVTISGGLWAAVGALVESLDARDGVVMWMERGKHGADERGTLPDLAVAAAGGHGAAQFGVLSGLEGGQLPEL